MSTYNSFPYLKACTYLQCLQPVNTCVNCKQNTLQLTTPGEEYIPSLVFLSLITYFSFISCTSYIKVRIFMRFILNLCLPPLFCSQIYLMWLHNYKCVCVCVCICELCLNARSIVYLHCTSYPSHRHNNLLMSVLQSPILNQNLFNYRLGSDVFVRIYVWVPYRQRFFLLFSCCCCYCCLCCALCMVWGSTPGRHHQPPSKGDNRNAYVRSTFSIYCVQINNVDASRWVNRNGSK